MPTPSAEVKARVLFVDDEPRVLTTMKVLFRTRYDVHFAESGDKALEFLKQHPVDVIVSDQRMPGMTGIELLRQARELNPHAMRILLTGYSDLNAIIGSINDGEIFRFVNKPWSNEDLTTTVARAVVAARATAGAAVTAGNTPAPAAGAPPGLLVLDDDPAVPPRLQEILGGVFRVYGATTLEQAVDVLEKERIGVVISETRVQNHPVVDLIGTLKQHHPELVSVILTNRADAGTAIELINQGQVYRFMTKPIHDTQCKIAINSALRQHHQLAHAPVLNQRYEVQKPRAAQSEGGPATPVAAGLLDRVKSIRFWVKRWV